MHDRDSLHQFLFEQFPVRGHIVHLDATWAALLEHRTYPAEIRDTLGEAVAASVLLASTVKFDGLLTLQLQGQGPMHLLLAQCTNTLNVRALARYREDPQTRDLSVLSGEGRLTVTVETDNLSQRYQGIVPLSGERLADCLQGYFENSEQLPTRLWLFADEQGASGMLLQRLPAGNVDTSSRLAEIDDAWNRVQLLADTLKPAELRTLSDRDILHRLFNEDDVRLFDPTPVSFRCKCSHERVESVLKSLGEAEVRSILTERPDVEVQCDFCNRTFNFDAVDVERIFKPGAGEGSGTVH
ncbi:MAG: Hsp33 family molecular chaperone HslO [Steroidobacteraceae bacterium]